MLCVVVVEEIERLLDAGGLSQRGIARRMGVSRGSVNAIALGKRPDPQTRRRVQEDALAAPAGPSVRCPTCGGMVQMPCLACRLRALKEGRRRPQRGIRSDRRQGAATGYVSTGRGEPRT
jgi:transcriptional regulator with XRE-family HTH domain